MKGKIPVLPPWLIISIAITGCIMVIMSPAFFIGNYRYYKDWLPKKARFHRRLGIALLVIGLLLVGAFVVFTISMLPAAAR